jgi:hypothetical protein
VKLYRPVTVLVGIVLVIIAGLIRLGEPEEVLEDTTRYAVRGKVGQPIEGIDFTLTVTRVKFAREVDPNPDDVDSRASDDERPMKTNGIFVTVEYQVEGRHKKGSAGDASLKTDGGSTYVPIDKFGVSNSVSIPAPGFVLSGSMVFETNPDDLAGLTLWLKKLRGLTVTTEDYAVDLGIKDEAAADDLVSNAERSYPMTKPQRRAAQ